MTLRKFATITIKRQRLAALLNGLHTRMNDSEDPFDGFTLLDAQLLGNAYTILLSFETPLDLEALRQYVSQTFDTTTEVC